MKPEYAQMLFTNPIGMRMLAYALAMQLMGMLVHILWTVLCSKKAPKFLSVLVCIGVVVFCYVPFMSTILVGPAAVAIYERLLVANPETIAAKRASDDSINRGVAWAEKKDYDRAIKDFNEAIRWDPKNAAAFFDRGNARLAKKEYYQAIRDFDEAIRLDPNYVTAFINRGNAWADLKEYDRAIRDFDEAIRLDPKHNGAFNSRGSAWYAKKEYDKAIQDYDEAMRLDTKYALAFNNKAWLLAACSNPKYRDGKRAVELASMACELTGWTDAMCLSTLGAAYAEAGDFEQAVKWQEKALADKNYAQINGEEAHKRLKLFRERKPYHEE
jgi:tetratricopeptide (TPR) repeat protein